MKKNSVSMQDPIPIFIPYDIMSTQVNWWVQVTKGTSIQNGNGVSNMSMLMKTWLFFFIYNICLLIYQKKKKKGVTAWHMNSKSLQYNWQQKHGCISKMDTM